MSCTTRSLVKAKTKQKNSMKRINDEEVDKIPQPSTSQFSYEVVSKKQKISQNKTLNNKTKEVNRPCINIDEIKETPSLIVG